MVGPVDFNKTLDYWQQDKWIGWFPVKWHIVKDVPNSFLKHIILENNENKPVTNSRDTQEVRQLFFTVTIWLPILIILIRTVCQVKLDQGLQLLKLFKEHVSKTSILDDFSFYETRQKVMQEKRLKQLPSQKKVLLYLVIYNSKYFFEKYTLYVSLSHAHKKIFISGDGRWKVGWI